MSEHTPTPWNCASRYSSVVGVPIVSRTGQRIGNTAIPDMPPEWDELKRTAEANAIFIVTAVNHFDDLTACVRAALNMTDGDGLPPDWDFLRRTLKSAEAKNA